MSPFNGASSAVKSKTPFIHRYHKYSERSPLSLLLFSNTNYGIHYVYTHVHMHTCIRAALFCPSAALFYTGPS